MRVIVTGATSFIGSHAVQALVSQGFEVCALIHGQSLSTALPYYNSE